MKKEFKSHPWHGVDPGNEAPAIVTAFIEIVPTDTVKYEIDKESGFLKIDRPQKFSNVVPSLYGFIPGTYCDKHVAALASKATGKKITKGDGDPLDICVFTERSITHGNILLQAIPIGGIRLIDKGEADDKIIAVLKDDGVHQWDDIAAFPPDLLKRLTHYFLTYKNLPGEQSTCECSGVFGKKEAHSIIEAALRDYSETFK